MVINIILVVIAVLLFCILIGLGHILNNLASIEETIKDRSNRLDSGLDSTLDELKSCVYFLEKIRDANLRNN